MLLHMISAPEPPARGSALALLAWSLALLGAIAVLTVAGGSLAAPPLLEPSAWGAWAGGRDALTIAFAVLRLLTLAVAWYLLGATVIGAVARLVRWRRVVVIADVLTVPAVRRLLQSALGLGLATAALTAGSSATPPPDAPPAATLTMTAQRDPDAVVMTPRRQTGEIMAPVDDLPLPQAGEREWTVEHGDHLWSIAERVLAREWGRDPTDDEIVGYWHRLITSNRDRLADPLNPDLIFPGQTLLVPRPPREP